VAIGEVTFVLGEANPRWPQMRDCRLLLAVGKGNQAFAGPLPTIKEKKRKREKSKNKRKE